MFRRTRRPLLAVATTAVLALGLMSGPASAQPQRGLVNVDISDLNVQVPIGVAANVCNVQANVLASGNFLDSGDCAAITEVTAENPGGGGGGGGPQEGLVNIRLTDVNVQIPIGVAANICNVQANVIASTNLLAPAGDCTAISRPSAEN